MANEKYITIPELAKLLGVSRIAIYNRVKKGQIPATKIGRTYVITDQTISNILGKEVTRRGKERIDAAVRKTVREYGHVLKQLGKE
ncbi:MAG: helix-turn-helix domain-containing protein [Deltaproteobacteria bacterium]|nr:helix-turn-helix domain-containing protein [Deltaproteobacteria bacterium]MBW1738709.1 helix-turn-helix domain-containing protein [Deltaproteobacteria bacterium]MBW1909165.1 helix-turn-helix domain-containing protein [Deltaproteobacteria bacterium]MBW2032626.1 helix-turn-helix domain-containing protein [Deltaproteobacteria bacterium]MBW2113533.1 helix-turn-helix domain-containing protein [Deltaproteobacteria bacterium]